jgi:sugar phosphate permease
MNMRQRWIRLLPIMMLTYIIAFMDRTNIAFSIPTMSKELGFAPSVVGFAAGVLFLGYGISQSAGGWLADRGHGKTLIFWLMLLWGITEMAQGLIHTAKELVFIRFLLGFFEGGIFPTMLLFVRNWFGPSERARANGIWQLSYPLAAMLSGPIAGYILSGGSWRTLFIIEGIFPIVWSLVWLWGVAESPREARWLTSEDRNALTAQLSAQIQAVDGTDVSAPTTIGQQLRRKPVVLFCLAVFLWNIGFLGFVIWLPSVLHQDKSLSESTIGWLSSVPFAVAIGVIFLLTWLSDKTKDRRLFSTLPILVCGLALIVAGQTYASNTLLVNMVLLSIAGSMLYGSQPVLWSIPAEIVPSSVLGLVMGIMNTFGVLGAFCGPYLVGYIQGLTHTFAAGLIVMGASMALASLLLWQIREVAARAMNEKNTARIA